MFVNCITIVIRPIGVRTECNSALSGRTVSKTVTDGGSIVTELKGLGFTDDVAAKIISKNKSLNLSEPEIKTLLQDLKSNSTLMQTITKDPENGIDAWKLFTDNKKAFCN